MSEKQIHPTQIYFSDLDGLRFFSFLAVYFYHSFFTLNENIKSSGLYVFFDETILGNGNLGVNFFFVLSGFLITYLLLVEKADHGNISIGNFYMRRVFRIWPLFYLIVFFGFVIFPKIKLFFGEIPNETADFRYYLIFLNNIDFIQKGLPDASMLGVLWSIAVEEQFYLVWPVLLYFIRPKLLPFLFTAIVLFSFGFRLVNREPVIYEHHTFSVISDMAVGGLGAWLLFFENRLIEFVRLLRRSGIIVLYIIVILVFLFRKELLDSFLAPAERILIAMLFLVVILEQIVSDQSIFKLSRFPVITYLGRISYGLYCFHFIGILITIKLTAFFSINDSLWSVLLLEPVLGLLITIGISYLSYRFYEKPFISLKQRFGRSVIHKPLNMS